MSFQAYKQQKITFPEKFDALRILSDAAMAQLDQESFSLLKQDGYEEISDEIIDLLASSENTSEIKTVQDFIHCAQTLVRKGVERKSLINIFKSTEFAKLSGNKLSMIQELAEKMTPDEYKAVLENVSVLQHILIFSDQEILDLVRLPKFNEIMGYIPKSDIKKFAVNLIRR